MTTLFDPIAAAYDAWYDSPEGRAVFREELECLRRLCSEGSGRWLEVGVGTGRFAAALGVSDGVDPSARMLALAAARGVRTLIGRAELLPYRERSFDGVLMALSLCFIGDPARALGECRRVLRFPGQLLLGVLPAEGPWAREYRRLGAAGHTIYSHARFRSVAAITHLAEAAGFILERSDCALFWPPGGTPPSDPRPSVPDLLPEAGFAALLFRSCKKNVVAQTRP
jgi:ubiquinone/menaquinone biosynthesis C-methylase UbiE